MAENEIESNSDNGSDKDGKENVKKHQINYFTIPRFCNSPYNRPASASWNASCTNACDFCDSVSAGPIPFFSAMSIKYSISNFISAGACWAYAGSGFAASSFVFAAVL